MTFKRKIVGLICDCEDCKKEIPADAEVIVMRACDEDGDDLGDSVYCSWKCAATAHLELDVYPSVAAYLPHASDGAEE